MKHLFCLNFSIIIIFGMYAHDTKTIRLIVNSPYINNFRYSDATTFPVDLTQYYKRNNRFNNIMIGKLRIKLQILNIRKKLYYSHNLNNVKHDPTNLRMGVGYDLFMNNKNKIGLNLEVSKLLITSSSEGIFSSSDDSFDKSSGKLKDITYSISSEYAFNNQYIFRTGYFYENLKKGIKQFATLGLGVKYNSLRFDTSYLINTSKMSSIIDNTFRFGITWDVRLQTSYKISTSI